MASKGDSGCASDPLVGTLRVFGLVPDTIVDGPGLRYAVFVQGCSHRCPGCHNPESQPTEGGTAYSIAEIYQDIVGNELVKGVTFSGGEPFEQPKDCATLAAKLKGDGYDIWAYSGYLFEELLAKAEGLDDTSVAVRKFLNNIDVLVDGPFVQDLKSYDLEWRGSSNQRLIDVPKSLASGSIMEWRRPSMEFSIPESW